MKTVAQLVEVLENGVCRGNKEREITNLSTDSRKIKANGLFICLRGAHVDGHKFVDSAMANGAVAIICDHYLDAFPELTQIIVADTVMAMQAMVPFFYDYPARSLRMIGVTGTNGKTTVTHMIAHILEDAGYCVGIIGTVNIVINGVSEPVHNTTPDVDLLQNTLFRMREAGVTHVVMEVSSHALALGRVAGCKYDTAVFTNLTQDHLDFHKTMDNYAAAKAKLFAMVAESEGNEAKAAVINSDDSYSKVMQDPVLHSHCRLLTYGQNKDAALYISDVAISAQGAKGTLHYSGQQWPFTIQSSGMFNVYNSLAAVGAALMEGIAMPQVLDSMASFIAVAGRFERVDEGQNFTVIVDYAHTPDGLENILRTAREITDGRVLLAFGCGGDRDAKKRPIMGGVAAKLADSIIITSDNPRSENPEQIVREVYAGAQQNASAKVAIACEVDRAAAIHKIIDQAQPGDVVLIAGKGHETYQILNSGTIHFDDREVARKALRGE